jgi:hypothetical protein
MPGELCDEYDGPFVGHYEKRYVISPEWSTESSYGNLPGRPELDATGKKIHETMLKMVKKQIDESDEKCQI